MASYSEWRHEDVLGLVPGLNEAVADPAAMDPAVMQACISRALDDCAAEIRALHDTDDFKSIRTGNDTDALFRVLEKMEGIFEKSYAISSFIQLAPLHYAEHLDAFLPALDAAGHQLQQYMSFVDQDFSLVIQGIADSSDERLQAALANPPERQRFVKMIVRCRDAAGYSPTSEEDFQRYNLAVDRVRQVADFTLSEDERKQAFAEGLSGMMRFKMQQAKAMRCADTLEQFARSNEAPVDLLHMLAETLHARTETLSGEFNDISELIDKRVRYSHELHKYSWQETQDIVCAAYARLDPELGKLARRAFDEGWIVARTDGIPNPCTYGGVPVSLSDRGHPFGAVTFDGAGLDVLFAGHEMAHVLSNYIAGEKHGVFTHAPSLLVQESFSHFGEALIEQEMLARAEGPVNKAAVSSLFATKEVDVLSIAATVKFEEDLYRLIESKGDVSPTFEEINALYQADHAALGPFNEKELDVRQSPAMWSLLQQPAHSIAVYPITKIMAASLYEAFERDPEGFRGRYRKVMEAGATIGIGELWDDLLGKGQVDHQSFLVERVNKISQRAAAVKEALLALPIAEKPAEEKAEDAPEPHVCSIASHDTVAQPAAGATPARRN